MDSTACRFVSASAESLSTASQNFRWEFCIPHICIPTIIISLTSPLTVPHPHYINIFIIPMAFVIPKATYPSSLAPFPSQTGPGSYQVQTSSFEATLEHCAPFNTSEVKTSLFDVEETSAGPGYYNSIYQKDLNKKAESKSYMFASRVERFHTQPDSQTQQIPAMPSPAKQKKPARAERSHEAMDYLRHQNRQNRVESIRGKREFIRVILTSTTNTENIESQYVERSISAKGVGPGHYQTVDYRPKVKSVPKWASDRIARFGSDKTLAPGPGAYEQQTSKDKNVKRTSAFASTQIRSHMDTVIYKTNIPIKAAILQDKRIKDSLPGPGTYNSSQWNNKKKSFNFGAQSNFGTSERGACDAKEPIVPGPGYYHSCHASAKSQIIKNMRHQIFQKPRRNKPTTDPSYSPADPTLTQLSMERKNQRKIQKQICSLEERCFSKLGNMSQAERFKLVNHLESEPGPGSYMEADPSLKRGHSAVFNSETKREVFEDKGERVPFYNVLRNDIGFRAEKMKRYIENLKKINIVKTPFQTSSKRFIEDKSAINLEIDKETPTKPPKPHLKCPKESSAFKSNTKREVFRAQDTPGPFDYDARPRDLEKKSYNTNYNYSPVRRAPARPSHPQ